MQEALKYIFENKIKLIKKKSDLKVYKKDRNYLKKD